MNLVSIKVSVLITWLSPRKFFAVGTKKQGFLLQSGDFGKFWKRLCKRKLRLESFICLEIDEFSLKNLVEFEILIISFIQQILCLKYQSKI